MLKISIHAQHTTMAGRTVSEHDGDCRSDDHIHWQFFDAADALAYAKQLEEPEGNDISGAYRRFAARCAATIREEVKFSV